MKKIAIVTDNLKQCFIDAAKNGGGYVVAFNLIKELSAMQEVELTVFTDENRYYDVPNVEVIEIDKNVWDKSFYEEVEKIVSEKNFDAILSLNIPFIKWNFLLQCHSFKHRLEVVPFFVKPFKMFFSRKKINQQKEFFSKAPKSVKFFAVSKIVKNDYEKHFGLPQNNVFTVYPACEQIFDNCPEKNKKEKITFGVVAGSSLNKGGHLLVFALGLVKLAGYDFRLKLIAPKYEKDCLLKGMIKVFGLGDRVDIRPYQEDMTDFYKNIDVLVLPSMNEAFGLVVLEAMSAGAPCVVSSTAGAAEIITDKNGFVFNRKSFNQLFQSLKKVIDLYNKDFELFEKYRHNAFETAKNFTWKKFAEEIVFRI